MRRKIIVYIEKVPEWNNTSREVCFVCGNYFSYVVGSYYISKRGDNLRANVSENTYFFLKFTVLKEIFFILNFGTKT
jgi:hypothetical protein